MYFPFFFFFMDSYRAQFEQLSDFARYRRNQAAFFAPHGPQRGEALRLSILLGAGSKPNTELMVKT